LLLGGKSCWLVKLAGALGTGVYSFLPETISLVRWACSTARASSTLAFSCSGPSMMATISDGSISSNIPVILVANSGCSCCTNGKRRSPVGGEKEEKSKDQKWCKNETSERHTSQPNAFRQG